MRCRVQPSDPDGDSPTIEWDLRRDVADDPRVGGDFEPREPPIQGAVLEAAGLTALLQLPAQPGKYRIFVYIRDGRGGAATANAPILVRKD